MFIVRAVATLLLMITCALLMLLVACLTAFQLRRFYSEGMATPMGKLALRIWGIRIRMHQQEPFPTTQAVYISNHTSTLDVFVLIALGLPNARFFLSGFLRKLLPLGVIGWLIGIFWTAPQEDPERRRAIFARASETLRRNGESVYLSPEGERVTTGDIGPFNKGAFHLATTLHAPIVPLFIAIPRATDPGLGLHARPGIIDVHVGETILTTTWRLEDLLTNTAQVRAMFVQWNSTLRGMPPK
ncbi:MAG: 1-acyl-sn-glycerol-3-phosphate acyltransferase [Gammaproteobacteria bacterium]|nr:1-acyl-sn-glycerol-3-phosphate acyltransferase [Gammaproteobacteria bacterium]